MFTSSSESAGRQSILTLRSVEHVLLAVLVSFQVCQAQSTAEGSLSQAGNCGDPQKVCVSYTVTVENPTNWIGLYRQGEPHSGYLSWVYLSSANGNGPSSGIATLPKPSSPGDYEFRLFPANGYTPLLAALPISIEAPPPAPRQVSMSLAASCKPGYICITYTATMPGCKDWIGLYRRGSTNAYGFLSYAYLKCDSSGNALPSGTVELWTPSGANDYEARAYPNSGYSPLIGSFIVPASAGTGQGQSTVPATSTPIPLVTLTPSPTPTPSPINTPPPAQAVTSVPLEQLAAGYSCDVTVANGDVYVSISKNGSVHFRALIGGGGALEELTDAKNSARLLMEHGYDHALREWIKTDRVFQETYWSFKTTNPNVLKTFAAGSTPFYLNINQAGDSVGRFQPVARVKVQKNAGNCSVEIDAIPQLDWVPGNSNAWQAAIAVRTIYTIGDRGHIRMETLSSPYALLAKGAKINGVVSYGYQPSYPDFVISTWLPFAPIFNRAGNHFTNGRDDWGYGADNIGTISNVGSVEETFGYTILHNTNPGAANGVAIGMVYGTKMPSCASATGVAPCPRPKHLYLPMGMAGRDPDNLILTRNWHVREPVRTGSVLYQALDIIPFRWLTQEKVDEVELRARALPAPVLFAPNAPLPARLASFKKFSANPWATYMSNHLGPVTVVK